MPYTNLQKKLVKKYQKYRRAGVALNNKILGTSLSRDVTMGAARLLGMLEQNDLIVFDGEEDTCHLMDFLLHDYKNEEGKSAVAIYQETDNKKSKMEQEILAAYLQSYSSLFQIVSNSPEESTSCLKDILNAKENIRLMDGNMSLTAWPGMLLFLRLVSLPEFNMTSGIAFPFTRVTEKALLKSYAHEMKLIKEDDAACKRYMAFLRLYRKYGFPVNYKNV